MGVFGRGGTRFFHALDEIGNGADECPHVFGGRDFNSVLDAAEKFLAFARLAESTPALLARRRDLRRYRRDVHAVHILSRNINRRGGGDYGNLLRVSGYGRHVGIILS